MEENKQETKPAETPANKPSEAAPKVPEVEGTYNPKQSIDPNQAVFYPLKDVLEGKTLNGYVDEIRKTFLKSFQKGRVVNYVLIGSVVFFAVVTMVFSFVSNSNASIQSWSNYVIWPLFGITVAMLIVSLVVSSSVKKKTNRLIVPYLSAWANATFEAAYGKNPNVTEASYSVDGKVSDIDVIDSHYWATIVSLDSRNKFVCKYKGKVLSDSELVVQVPPYSEFASGIAEQIQAQQPKPDETAPEEKAKEEEADQKAEAEAKANESKKGPTKNPNVGAFGKYMAYDLKAKDNAAIIVVRRTEETYLPTNVKAYRFFEAKAKELGDDFVIWADSEATVDKVLTPEVKKTFQSMATNSVLLDWFFAFNPKGAFFCFGYSDDIMELPLKVTPSEAKLMEYPLNAQKALSVFDSLIASHLGE